MKHWNEVRTAYAVARLGTVSAAADALGLHRATVIRHIDALEDALGVRLFQRHARGYTPTDAGLDLRRVAKVTSDQLADFAGRARGRAADVTGELVVTSLELVAPLVARAIARFRAAHPATTVRYITSGRILELAYGEAHIAVRAGKKPDHPDNVALPFFRLRSTFYAHDSYVQTHGLPTSEADFSEHTFVSHAEPARAPFFQWLEATVPPANIVLRSGSQQALVESVRAGVGIGFMPEFRAAKLDDIHEVLPPKADWFVPMWLVTHVDLHRSPKVQAISSALRDVVDEEGLQDVR